MKCERQTGDDEEENIEEQEEKTGEEGIRTGEVIEATHMLKRGKAAGHDNIMVEMFQNMGEMNLRS